MYDISSVLQPCHLLSHMVSLDTSTQCPGSCSHWIEDAHLLVRHSAARTLGAAHLSPAFAHALTSAHSALQRVLPVVDAVHVHMGLAPSIDSPNHLVTQSSSNDRKRSEYSEQQHGQWAPDYYTGHGCIGGGQHLAMEYMVTRIPAGLSPGYTASPYRAPAAAPHFAAASSPHISFTLTKESLELAQGLREPIPGAS